jgi:hypothetical protein
VPINTAINSYECVKCQSIHFQGQRIYNAHIHHQSKHGISKTVPCAEVVFDYCPGSRQDKKQAQRVNNGFGKKTAYQCGICGRIFMVILGEKVPLHPSAD